MSGVLYRKYRSKSFSEIVGQDVVTKTLKSAILQDRVSHAYIFSGPRGTGKTSTARLLAKAVNCLKISKKGEPCNKCSSCLMVSDGSTVDIIEIDAASHTGVDDIRGIIEKVEFAPVHLKKKVYIIDEAHMLSKSAFNALLKTLEEPPAHVIFILATTEIHKIPVTILSRCQRFDFRLGKRSDISKVLNEILKGEEISMEESAMDYIVKLGGGSYRDSITVLEQLVSNKVSKDGVITREEVEEILGLPDRGVVIDFVNSIRKGSAQEALDIIDDVMMKGGGVDIFVNGILEYLRELLITGVRDEKTVSEDVIDPAKLYKFIKVFHQVSIKRVGGGGIPQLPLELAVIELVDLFGDNSPVPIRVGQNSILKTVRGSKGGVRNAGEERSSAKEKKEEVSYESDDDGVAVIVDENPNLVISFDQVKACWTKIIIESKPYNGMLFAFLAKSKLDSLNDRTLGIVVPKKFYKEQIEDQNGQDALREITSRVLGAPLRIVCTIGEVTEDDLNYKRSDLGEALEKEVMDVFGEDVV